MKERPILFSAPMVRAILAGAKTQTRRIMKPQPEVDSRGEWQWPSHACRSMVGMRDAPCLSPYGYKGDRLWVRETFYCDNTTAPNWNPGKKIDATPELVAEWRDCLYYRADAKATGTCCELIPECACAEFGGRSPWKPSIFMPRWASRITLDITAVRVERLHAITDADAKSEGAAHRIAEGGDLAGAFSHVDTPIGYRNHFADLWRSINGAESWDENHWVWVVEFKRIDQQQRAEAA